MRNLTVALAVILFTASVPAVIAAGTVNAAVSSVSVSPESPAPGDTVTLTTTIENLPSSDDPLEITAVALRGAGNGINEYSRVENIGTVSVGSTIEVPLTRTFESAGTKNLRVHVYAKNKDTDESVKLRYPVSVEVRDRHPQVDVQTNGSVAGVQSTGIVTIANGLDTDVSNVEVTVDGSGIEMLEHRTVLATLRRGEETTARFTFRPKSSGSHKLNVTLHYTVYGDTRREVTRTKTIGTEERNGRLIIDTSPAASGSQPALSLEIVNQGNTPAKDLVVTAKASNATFERALVSEIPAGSSEHVRLNATMTELRADATITVRYEQGSSERTLSTSEIIRSDPGRIELTGLDVSREGDKLNIAGSASNLGSTGVNSVVVRVLLRDGITPAFPNKEYFVGTVPPSDFVSFDVYATTSGRVTTIPLEAEYTVGNERVREQFEVTLGAVGGVSQPEVSGDTKQSGGMLPMVLGGVVTITVGGIIVTGWRRKS